MLDDWHDELHLPILRERNGRIPALHFHREIRPIADPSKNYTR